jgi:type IV secretion system protein VirB4
MSRRAPRLVAAGRELPAAHHIPYTAHVAANVLRTTSGHYVQTFRLQGVAFETRDDADINNWHERLNVAMRNIAGPTVALWTHLVRRRDHIVPRYPDTRNFAGSLLHAYEQRLSRETLMRNELYLSLVYKPTPGRATNALTKLLSRNGESAELDLQVADAIDVCSKLRDSLLASLGRYDPEPLAIYRRNDRLYSAPLEFLELLVSGEVRAVPVPRTAIGSAIGVARPLFGSETLEYRAASASRFGAFLGIKEYATPTTVGMFDTLLAAPISCVLTQSFAFLTKATAQGLMQRQHNRFINAGDFAVSQANELRDALDALTANEFAIGDHHLSLQLLSDAVPAGSSTSRVLAQLNDNVALAMSMLADSSGMTIVREDLAAEAAFWSQLPGNFSLRPRKAPVTTRNFAAMSPWHNYPAGRATGNHWGEALATFATTANSLYHFSLHASDPKEIDGGGRKDAGHTFILGPTGSGKTVVIAFLILALWLRQVTQVIFDKDRGLELVVRAVDGLYIALTSGEPSGLNPLQLDPTPTNIEFLKRWLRLLVRGQSPISTREEVDLDQALRGTLALERPLRRLSRLVEFTDATKPDGIHARLARWCDSTRGEYAWAFDSPEDTVVPQLARQATIGFDVTHFISHEMLRAPTARYLFHIVEQLLDGRKFTCWIDEFSRTISDPDFEDFAKNGPEAWRKMNGVICMAAQTASSVVDSRIARTLIEGTPTRIYFPNPEASRQQYVDQLGLSEREFQLIKQELEPGARAFLIKQGHNSVVGKLDLKAFLSHVAVMSGRTQSVRRLHELMEELGAQSSAWLPTFMSEHS